MRSETRERTRECALAAETALSLHEYVAARMSWDYRVFRAHASKAKFCLNLAERGVHGETGVGEREEEVGIWAPECIIEL